MISVHKNINKIPRHYLINNMIHNATKSKYVSQDVWHTVVIGFMNEMEIEKGMRHMLNHIKSFVPWILKSVNEISTTNNKRS